MNIGCEVSESASDILYVNFNQESSALSVGTKSGYKLYTLQDSNKFEPDFECITNEDVCIVERHFLSSLVAVVKLSAPRKLIFYNFKTAAEIAVKHFSNTILAIKLNRKVFVVCLEDSLHIFDIMKMNLEHVVTNTPSNPRGICALTVTSGNSLLAYPGSSTVGDIQIFDVTKLLAKSTIPAHNNPVVAMAFNEDGSKIASASEKGTVIRIFSVASGQSLFEFRRGVRRCVTIYSLSFSSGSEYLAASSNTETVHIFKLTKEENISDIEEESETWMGAFGKMLTHSAKYLPSQMSDVLTQMRSFATIHLPFAGLKNISCITRFRNVFHVFVASSDGFMYSYNLNPEGGPCTLSKQHRIDGSIRSSSMASDKDSDTFEEKRSSSLNSDHCSHKTVWTDGDPARSVAANRGNDNVENDTSDHPPLCFSVS